MKIPTQENIEEVKRWLELNLDTGKVSSLLISQLAHGWINRTLNVHIIYGEIGVLEGVADSRSSNTKPPTQFTGRHLLGLWHKHYTEPSHIVENIKNHWGKNLERFAFIEDEILAGQETVEMTPEVFINSGGKVYH